MKYFCWSCIAAASCLYPAAGYAQMSILPDACAGKTGEALDQCVREITLPQRTQRLEPVEPKADPKAIVNCVMVNRADQDFCIMRNEIIIACRNRLKNPDFDQCLASRMTRPPLPQAADCSRSKPELRHECTLRNRVYGECVQDPLRYFICLGEKITANSAPAAPRQKP